MYSSSQYGIWNTISCAFAAQSVEAPHHMTVGCSCIS